MYYDMQLIVYKQLLCEISFFWVENGYSTKATNIWSVRKSEDME